MDGTDNEQSSSDVKIINFGTGFPYISQLIKLSPAQDIALPMEDEPFSSYTICYSSRGWQTWLLGDRYCYLPTGHFLFAKPGEFLSLGDKMSSDSQVYLLRFSLPEEESDSFLGFTREETGGLFLLLNEYEFPVIRIDTGHESLMEDIYRFSGRLTDETQDKPVLNNIRVKNLLRELFLTLAEGKIVFSNALDSLIDSVLPRLPAGGYSPLVGKAIGHMSENLYDGLTLISLADDVNISLSRFKALFKGETGLTPLEFYTRLSIQKSLELLHQSPQSIRSIASSLGFSSARYFSSVFTKTIGMTPEEFRLWEGRNR